MAAQHEGWDGTALRGAASTLNQCHTSTSEHTCAQNLVSKCHFALRGNRTPWRNGMQMEKVKMSLEHLTLEKVCKEQ